mmetsp:Transcript_38713/g.86661  ORF Transcript_38713/g.86661 Transcript_38713/m.86661 type:complete len:323 (+) Transcript_38713:85-1053(+)
MSEEEPAKIALAEAHIPTSTTDLELEPGSPAGVSSGHGEAEPLSPESEGGAYPPAAEHGGGLASEPRYVNLECAAPPGLQTMRDMLPQKLPLPLLEGVREVMALQEDAKIRSSDLHAQGICRPCAWFWHESGCQNGEACEFCHLCPPGELKARRKHRVKLLRALKQSGVASAGAQDPEDVDASPESSGASSDRRGLDLGVVDLPSIGSAAHGVDCRPCAWFWKSEGCKNGKDCRHCHLCPEGEIRRKKKQKQEDMKKHALTATSEPEPDDMHDNYGAGSVQQQHFQQQLLQMQLWQQMQTSMMMAGMAQFPQVGYPSGGPFP